MGKQDNSLTFEQAMARLDQIASALDEGTVSLDNSLALFSEGAGLIAFCNQSLEKASLTIEELFPTDGQGTKKPKANSER